MRTTIRMSTLILLWMTAMRPYVFAQAAATPQISGCMESHRSFAPKNPKLAEDGSIIAGQRILQSRVEIDKGTTVSVIEYPSSGKDIDAYGSTIIVERDQQRKKYPLKELIKGGEVLRVVETAELCSAPDQGVVFLAFEAGATGAAVGFVMIQYSPQSVEVEALPMAAQGRIVVKRKMPEEVELWSATDGQGIACDACKKLYTIEDCHIGQQVECKKRSGVGVTLSPSKLMRARIEVQ